MSDNVQKEQKLQQIIANAMHSKLEAPIYIASGFFNETQKQGVQTFENLLSAQGKNFYSPRQHSIDFSKIDDIVQKAAIIKSIFASNVEKIDESEKIIALLDMSAGAYDIGAIWELGYAVASYTRRNLPLTNIDLNLPNDGNEWVIEKLRENLGNIAIEFLKEDQPQNVEKSNKTLLIAKDNTVNAPQTIRTLGYNMEFINLGAILGEFELVTQKLRSHESFLFVTDNRPFTSTALMGLMYGLKLEYSTASMQNYGSNVMIAASSQGHMQLPAFYDEKKSKRQID